MYSHLQIAYLVVVGQFAAPAWTQLFNRHAEIGAAKLELYRPWLHQQSTAELSLYPHYALCTQNQH